MRLEFSIYRIYDSCNVIQSIMNVEIELKLRVPHSSLARLGRHPLLKSGKRAVGLCSIYFDTPGLELKSKAIALRLRKEGRNWVQTFKGGGGVLAGVHTRNEWEFPVSKGSPDFTKLDDPFLIGIFSDETLRRNLEPIFFTEFSRKTVPVEYDGSVIEYCLDRGRVVSNEREEPISEIELELKSGNPSALFEFALELQKTAPLFVEGTSKAERGYSLYLGHAYNRVKKASIADLDRKMDVAESFREILRGCMEQLQGNVKGFLDGEEDPEYLHQMRVGLRRMRSAFSLFSGHFGRQSFSEIIPELRWLGTELGPARNWDVFVFETISVIEKSMAGQCDLDDLRKASQLVRKQHAENAFAALSSQRFQTLLLKLGSALCNPSWPAGERLRAADFAERMLDRRYRRFVREGENITALGPVQLHALRISGKKLRYAAEFFSTLYPNPRDFLKAMAGIQDVLGAVNDAATTNHLLEELPGVEQGPKCLVRGWVGSEARNRIAQAGSQWKAFGGIMPFWR